MTNAEKTAVFVLNDMEEKNRKATQNQKILAHLFALPTAPSLPWTR